MRVLVLYWRLLRYRVAVMIVLFLLLGAAWQGSPEAMGLSVVLGALALGSSYVSATSVNDIADEEVDAINHPGDRGRPLVTGAAEAVDLWLVAGAAAALSLAFSLTAGGALTGMTALSLVVGALYSLPPARLSYRTFLAPLSLAVAYVGIPYWMGAVAAGGGLGASDASLLAALYLLFLGRILLKDFRDREGDAAHGKPTLLLRYGKPATCLASLAAVCLGDTALISALSDKPWLAALLQPYIASVLIMLYRLHGAGDRREEQLAIGVGAKMGNGLLATLLGVVILAGYGADRVTQVTFVLALTAVYAINFVGFLRDPDRAVIGYKG